MWGSRKSAPIKEEYLGIKEKFSNNKNIHVSNVALGEKQEDKTLNVMMRSGVSSFYDLNENTEWWDFEKNSALTFQEILPASNITVDFNMFIKTYIPINFSYWKKYRLEQVTKKELKYLRLKETFDTLDYDVNDDIIHHLSEEYILKLPNYNNLFEGTFELLEYLQKKYKLHMSKKNQTIDFIWIRFMIY